MTAIAIAIERNKSQIENKGMLTWMRRDQQMPKHDATGKQESCS